MFPKVRSSALAAMAALMAISAMAQAGEDFERFGDIAQIALPTAAAVCAARQARLRDYAGDFAVQFVVVHGLKNSLGDASIGRRPSGGDKGFPSGHTSSAVSGASDLARHCFRGNEIAAGIVYGTAAAVGLSRIESDAHNPGQVTAGAIIGFTAGAVSFAAGPGSVGFRIGFEF